MEQKIQNSIESVYRNKLNLAKSYDALRDSIKELVRNCGGYINTANNDGQNDNIYGAVYMFGGSEELVEVMIKAVRLKGESLYCYCVPVSHNVSYTDKEMEDDTDNWYLLDMSSELIYGYTLHNLADVFEYGEYV